ncbi:MAG: tRNA (adenosine(37)-N6)-threonylcarbamoyltransferase complex dimerization subunit type 1 TsaB [Rhizobacter sp.]|nr:tRNA (adenosine(37)-N6)-threonylcarbamoyltransferase complex dimerization subunit type 1 TsaB [Rhizobacter sp.]
MARLLAFDTSTEAMSMALVLPHGLLVRELAGGPQASARLIPELIALLAEAHCTLAQLDAIAFGRGPGAFTGLRTACSVAQGLAFGADKPVIAVDSLMLVAQDALHQHPLGSEVWVAMDARMDEIYAGAYRWQGGRWSVLSAPALYAVEALNQRWQAEPPAVIAGSALDAFGDRLHVAAAVCIARPRSRAQALAAVAQQLWAEGATTDAAQALPLYLRDKVAQTTVEREAIRLAKEATT